MGFPRKNIGVSCHFLLHSLLWWLRWQSMCLECRRPGFDPWVGKIPLEKEMAPHSSTLAWKIPWMGEPGRLQFMGLQRVGHDWATSLSPGIFLTQRSNCYLLHWQADSGFFYHWVTWEDLDNSISCRFPELFCRYETHPAPTSRATPPPPPKSKNYLMTMST